MPIVSVISGGENTAPLQIPTDPFFANVVLLVHADTDPPVDSSDSAHVLTEGSTWALDTTNPKFGAGCSDHDGTGNSVITAPDSADWNLAAGEFTIELQVRPDGSFNSGTEYIFLSQYDSGQKNFQLGYFPTNNLRFVYSTTGSNDIIIDRPWTPVVGTYNHIAVSRTIESPDDLGRLFVDGVLAGAPFDMDGDTLFDSSELLYIGGRPGSLRWVSQLDEIRITKVSRYPNDFTPPNAAFPDA